MFVGVLLGRLLRGKIRFSLSPYILIVISLLLALLGIELGFNEQLLSKFKDIGVSSIVISSFSVIGSCIAAFFFGKLMKEERGNGK